jgi:hypothetical protein
LILKKVKFVEFIFNTPSIKGGLMFNRRLHLVAILCCFLIGLNACSRKWAVIGAAAAAVGAGTYYYVKGDLKRNYEASMDKTWEATIKAVEELKLTVESQNHDGLSGVIKGKTADDKSFEINLKRLDENSTEVGVRIGTFGDRAKSEAIQEKINSKL